MLPFFSEDVFQLMKDELDELKKRARVQNDIGALEKSADEYADKAEISGKLTFITKSNSLRRPVNRRHLFKTLGRKSMRSLLK
ncbi:hypothetical protein KUCAC02_023071 [Chaenocephalus aceratus]|uniref:Uncharacterized protein n=1 Tax=Chaenocephalus aceratus TaxID=36190 RepID=A0ACB9XPL4_CHAAC|nr:hypothetical protein KUCAC02_023071 [Chaenocephalus aceratus]